MINFSTLSTYKISLNFIDNILNLFIDSDSQYAILAGDYGSI